MNEGTRDAREDGDMSSAKQWKRKRREGRKLGAADQLVESRVVNGTFDYDTW